MAKAKPKLGVSACLLGRKVRYDGAHQLSAEVLKLRSRFRLVPICPEVEMGLGVPRPTIRIIDTRRGPKLLQKSTGSNLTELALRSNHQLLEQHQDCVGFILKSRSPSCGLRRVKLYRNARSDTFSRRGRGFFAALIEKTCPGVPLIDEKGLANPERLRKFLLAVRKSRPRNPAAARRR